MSTKVKAIVIGAKDYKDKDKLITLYSLEQGKLVCSMRGVRGEKAKLKAAKDIFTFGEYIIEEGKGFNIVTQVEVIDSFFGLSQNIDKYYEACAILDIVSKISSQQSDPPLFINLIKCLKTLCYDDVPKFYAIDKFLISVFQALGYSFLTEECSSCHGDLLTKRFFELNIGEFVCPACRNASCIEVSEPCFRALKILDSTDYERLCSIRLGGRGEIESFKLLQTNFEWRMGAKFCDVPII